MKFREIFRFEFVYQARRIRTWLYFAVLFFAAFQLRGTATRGHAVSPWEIAQESVLAGLLWVLMAPAVAGSAAARDVETRMQPLIYAAPISKADYLGGRFLAAFALNATILLAVPLGTLTAMFLANSDAEGISALPPAVFLSCYGLLLLPTAFIFTAVQFSVATLKRRPMVSYLGTVLFFGAVGIAGGVVNNVLQMPRLGKLMDPTCRMNVIVLLDSLTPFEKNTGSIGLEGSIIANRLVWISVALAVLAFTYVRFRPGHRAER